MSLVLNSFQVKEGHCQHSLGAQSISKYCESKGYNINLVSSPLDVKKPVSRILSLDPIVCGLSSNYVTEPYVIEIARIIKQERGDKTFVIIGGPSVTYSSNKSKIRKSDADIFVKGYGEEAFYQILKNTPKSILEGKIKIPGVSTKHFSNESMASVDLSSLSSLFPLGFETDHVYWETARGCAFSCIYCAHPGQKNQFECIPSERIIKEVDYLVDRRFRAVYITDPILGGKKDRSKEILKLLKKLNGSFITAEYHLDYLDEEVMDLLEEAQIGWLEFGLQTTNPKLAYFRKNSSSTMEKLARLSKRKIKYSLDLIVGIPGDARESFEDSLKFAIEVARPTFLKVFPLRIYDGTKLHEMAKSNNSWAYDENTRIIKQSNTFDESEFLKWKQLGKTCMHLYHFFQNNKWFNNDSKFRNLEFFINFSDKFGSVIPEEYDEKKIQGIWEQR